MAAKKLDLSYNIEPDVPPCMWMHYVVFTSDSERL